MKNNRRSTSTGNNYNSPSATEHLNFFSFKNSQPDLLRSETSKVRDNDNIKKRVAHHLFRNAYDDSPGKQLFLLKSSVTESKQKIPAIKSPTNRLDTPKQDIFNMKIPKMNQTTTNNFYQSSNTDYLTSAHRKNQSSSKSIKFWQTPTNLTSSHRYTQSFRNFYSQSNDFKKVMSPFRTTISEANDTFMKKRYSKVNSPKDDKKTPGA